MSVPLENHLVQCMKNISNKYLKQFENSFFVPLTSSIAIDLEDLSESQILKLNLNQIPPPNPVTFPLKPQGKIDDKLEELFDQCEYVGMNEEIFDQQLINQIIESLQKQESQIENLLQDIRQKEIISEQLDKDDDIFLDGMKNIDQLNEDLKKAIQQKQNFINQNIHYIIQHYRAVVGNIIENNESFSVNVYNKSSSKDPYNHQNLEFSKFNYDSAIDKIIPSQNQNYDQLQADALKNFGIGKQLNEYKLEQSIDEAFEQIAIQCESSSVQFQRKWLPIDILQNKQLGIKDKQINQWSNGKQNEQQANAEFPYIIVGAVICKNIQIEGFMTSRKTIKNLNRIQTDGDSCSILIFKLQNESKQIQEKDYTVSQDPPIVFLKSPRIIGYILQPIFPFPLVVHQKGLLFDAPKQIPFQEVEEEIKQFLESNCSEDEIVQFYETNQKVISFPNWRTEISQIIKKFQNPIIQLEPYNLNKEIELPKFKDFQQKSILIKRFLNAEQRQKDKDNTEEQLNHLYQQLQKNEILILMDYFEKNNIITNTIDSVFEEEEIEFANIVKIKKMQNDQIDFEELSCQLLIKKEVLQNLYEKLFEPLQIDAQIELKRDEIIGLIDTDQDILDYFKKDKSVTLIPRWQDQIQEIVQQEIDKKNVANIKQDAQDVLIQKQDEIQEQYIEVVQAEIFREEIKQETEVPLNLPLIENYSQKQILVANIKSGIIVEDINLENQEFEQKYNGLSKQVVRQCFKYYKNQGDILSISRDEIMQEEKNLCFQIFFKQYGESQNFIKLSNETLISQKLLEQLYEEFQRESIIIPKDIEKQRDYIKQMLQSEMDQDEILKHYQENEKEIQKVQDWRIYLIILINRLKNSQDIPDAEDEQIIKIDFINYKQKQFMIDKLRINEFQKNKNYPQKVLEKQYQKLTNEQIQQSLIIYEQNNQIITLRYEELMPEEKALIIESFKTNNNFKDLSIQYMVHESIIKQIYYDESFDEELLSIFQESLQLQNPQQIKEILSEQHEKAKYVLIDLFMNDAEKYQKIIDICQNNAFSYLLQNKVTNFFKILSERNDKDLQSEINKLSQDDPILLLKILRSLDQQNRDNEQQKQEKDLDIFQIREKETLIIDVNQNNDLIAVVVKALKLLNKQDQKKAIFQLEQLETFQKFKLEQYSGQQKELLINKFLIIENNQEINQNQKYQQFEQLIENQFDILEKSPIEYDYMKQYTQLNLEILQYNIKIEQQQKQQSYKNNQISQLQGNIQQNFKNNNSEIEAQINNKEDENNNNIFQLFSEQLKKSIVLHKSENILEYKIFGEQFLNREDFNNCIHLVLDSKNKRYSILHVDHCQIVASQIHVQSLQNNHPNIYQNLQPWFREFMGFKSFQQFIYNKNDKQYKTQNIQKLQKLVENLYKYQENYNDNLLVQLYDSCDALSDSLLFQEWYMDIAKTDFGKIFTKDFDIYWARTNPTKQFQVQEKVKHLFPNPVKPLNLRDFNRIRACKDKNEIMLNLQMVKNSPVQFIHVVIQQIFGDQAWSQELD